METRSNVKRRRFKAEPEVVEALPEFGQIVRWILEMEDELDRPLRFADIRQFRKGGKHKKIADTLHEVNRTYGYEFARMRLKAAEVRAVQGGAGSDGSPRKNGAPQAGEVGLPAPPDPDTPAGQQREAWQRYWHEMTCMFPDNLEHHKAWLAAYKADKMEPSGNDVPVIRTFADDLKLKADLEGVCPGCRELLIERWDVRDPATYYEEMLEGED